MKSFSFALPTTLFFSFVFLTSNLSAETAFWERKANGELLFDCNGGAAGGEHFNANNSNWGQSRVVEANPCGNGPPVARDVALSNWTTDLAPNSPSVDVVIAGSSPLTVLNIDASVATLSIASTNELRIDGTNTLSVFGGMIQNDGRITIDDLTLNFATLQIHADTLLSGTGTLYFDDNDDNVVSSSDPAYVLTIGTGQKILTSATTVAGDSASRIITSLRNEGRITASLGALQLDTNPKFNTSIIEAISGGTIVLRNVSLDNTGGTLIAGAASSISLDTATVTGGILQGSGQFEVTTNHSATFAGPLTIAPDATIFVNGTQNILSLTGTVTNNGTVRIFDTGANFAELQILGNVTLLGSGQILLDGNDDSRITAAAAGDVLTIGPDQKVTTTDVTQFDNARIIAAFTNQGTITANVGDLQLDTNPKTNNSLIQAVGSGEILFKDVTVGNANGIIRAGSGSKVQLQNAIIHGGRLEGGGRFDVIRNGGGTLNGPLEIATGTIVSVDTSDVLNLSGTITNNGSLEITDSTTGIAVLRIVGDVTLAGTGRVLFLGNDDDIFDSANPADTLTIGPNQEVTTSPVALAGSSHTAFRTRTINNGIVSANIGGLRLETNPKTNNGIFRASGGGTLELFSANTLLTNYNSVSGVLTGGRYESIGNGSTIIFQNALIKEIAPGTAVALAGAGATIPALGSLQRIDGTLSLRDGATLTVPQSLAVSGRLEFGLGSGNTTALAVTGNLNLTGAVIDVSDLGAIDGNYQIITATGTITGTPTLGNIPPGLGISVVVVGGVVTVGVITAPEILDIARNAGTGVVTITYQSISGEAFRVEGNTDLSAIWQLLPNTAVGNGGIKTYTNTPPAAAERYFYRMARGF